MSEGGRSAGGEEGIEAIAVDNLSNIVRRVQDFKFSGVTSVSNYIGTTKFRRKLARSVWCSFHDRVADLNGDRSSLVVLLV